MESTQNPAKPEVMEEGTELDGCYHKLRLLRDRMAEATQLFLKSSTLYYVLEHATHDPESAPLATITLDIPSGDKQFTEVAWPLADENGLISDTVLPLFQIVSRNYRDSWFAIKEIADEAVAISKRIAELSQADPTPMPELEPNKGS